MNLIAGYVLPALLVSAAALAALRFARSAPPGIQFGLALFGLLAWAVPWFQLSVPPLALSPVAGIGRAIEVLVPIDRLPRLWWVAVALPGLFWFFAELIGHRITVNRWRRDSRSGHALERLLPAEIRSASPDIRIVSGSSIAVATGWIRPTIFIGDRIASEDELRIALTHEASHIRRSDPAWLMIVGLIARLFWFNPFAYVLRRHAILAIEAGCDQTCARLLGRQRYRNTLAQLVLHSHQRKRFALAPMLHSTSIDLTRLALLEGRPRMDARAWIGVCLMLLTCAVGAQMAAQPPASPAVSAIEIRERMADASHYGYDIPPTWRLHSGVDQ